MALLINADTYKTLALTKNRMRKIGIPMLIACSLQLSVYSQTVMNLKFSKNSFLASPVERENYNLEFTDEFDKKEIDQKLAGLLSTSLEFEGSVKSNNLG